MLTQTLELLGAEGCRWPGLERGGSPKKLGGRGEKPKRPASGTQTATRTAQGGA